jgi:uncharacterized repeat protein (TIGR03847 family)
MSASFELDTPDHFTAGAIGQPGQRVFYLQGRQPPTLVSLKCEKEQVGALAEYISGLLAQLSSAGPPAAKEADLLEPIEAAWAVGSIGVGYDRDADRIIVEVTELVDEEEDREAEAATARFRISRAQAAAFVERARALIKGGRPTCPMCGQGVDPGGHFCPRANGHQTKKD